MLTSFVVFITSLDTGKIDWPGLLSGGTETTAAPSFEIPVDRVVLFCLAFAAVVFFGFLQRRERWGAVLVAKGVGERTVETAIAYKSEMELALLGVSLPLALGMVMAVAATAGVPVPVPGSIPLGLLGLALLGLLIFVSSRQIVGFGEAKKKKVVIRQNIRHRRAHATPLSSPVRGKPVAPRAVESASGYLHPEPRPVSEVVSLEGWDTRIGSCVCREWNTLVKGRLLWTKAGIYFEQTLGGSSLATFVIPYRELIEVVSEEIGQRLSLLTTGGMVSYRVPNPQKTRTDIAWVLMHARRSGRYF